MPSSFAVDLPLRVAWGACDPAGVVHLSQWFRWFDLATWNYFEHGGLPLQEMMRRYGNAGLPLVSIDAEIKAPARVHEEIAVETSVSAWKRKTLEMRHVFRRGTTVLLEGSESRIWALRDATRPNGMRAADIPAEVVEHFRRLAPG
jgi:4-hydroxybenzoyl-CoA thioesterase